MLEELARLHAEVPNLTVIYVTHDPTGALTIADRIGIMRNGVLRWITLPLLLPYLIAAWSLSFALSMGARVTLPAVLVGLSLALARGADSHIDLAQLRLASCVLCRDAAGNAAF